MPVAVWIRSLMKYHQLTSFGKKNYTIKKLDASVHCLYSSYWFQLTYTALIRPSAQIRVHLNVKFRIATTPRQSRANSALFVLQNKLEWMEHCLWLSFRNCRVKPSEIIEWTFVMWYTIPVPLVSNQYSINIASTHDSACHNWTTFNFSGNQFGWRWCSDWFHIYWNNSSSCHDNHYYSNSDVYHQLQKVFKCMYFYCLVYRYYQEKILSRNFDQQAKNWSVIFEKEHGYIVCCLFFKTEVTSEDTHLVSCNNNTEYINSFKHRFESTGMLLERSDLKITGDLGQGMHYYIGCLI